MSNIFDSESSSSSDGETKQETKPVNTLFGSDSSSESEKEQEDQPEIKPTVTNTTEDLFGDSDSSESDKEPVTDQQPSTAPQKDDSSSSSSSDEEEMTRINVELPKMTTNLGEEIHFCRLPNFLSFESRPFDRNFYQDENDEQDNDEVIDEEGRARLRLKVENTIRWRNVEDAETGQTRRESNARMIRYSDGSLCMQVGQEMFDVTSMPLTDYNHLFIRQGTGLQGQAVFKQKLTFRPISTDSLTHQKVMNRLQQRAMQNVTKIKVLPTVTIDPEKQRQLDWKQDDERYKAFVRKERIEARNTVKQRGSDKNKLSADYLNSGKRRSFGANIYSSDSDSEDEKKPRKKPETKSKSKPGTISSSTASESNSDDQTDKKKKMHISSSSDSETEKEKSSDDD